MRVIRFERNKYVAIENEGDKDCIKTIINALVEQVRANPDIHPGACALVEREIDTVLDLRDISHGVLCFDEDTKGY